MSKSKQRAKKAQQIGVTETVIVKAPEVTTALNIGDAIEAAVNTQVPGAINVEKAVIVQGRKSNKNLHKSLGFDDLPDDYSPIGTGLGIDKALKEELKENDLAYRFIYFKKYKQQGFHKSRWVPYKRDSEPSHGAVFTVDPSGYTIYQDLVLAVKPMDWQHAHKKYLQKKANRQSNTQKMKAEELREHMKSSSTPLKVDEGYED